MVSQQQTPEEDFLWHCAKSWRTPLVPAGVNNLDWQKIVTMAIANRMATLLQGYLQQTGLLACLPAGANQSLQTAADKLDRASRFLGQALATYLHHAAAEQQTVIAIKGLWLAIEIYGQANLRPGNDIDLLLPKSEISAACALLEQKMGYGRWWRPLLDDQFYLRHHLHAQRCNHGRGIWFELHWAFDHPYSQLTIDYAAIFQRTRPGQLLGEPVRLLSLPDLLLSLAVHLVKHAVYLPVAYTRPELPRLLIADEMVIYFLDVAEMLKKFEGQIDWKLVVELAHQWGAVDILGSVLPVCQRYLAAPVPAWVIASLPVSRPGTISRYLLNELVNQLNQPTSGRLWPLLTDYKENLIFRPIRLLDFLHYLLPNSSYLRRRYQSNAVGQRFAHFGLAVGQYGRVAADILYFSWRRYQRLQALSPAQQAIFDARYDPE